jgi:hypothetical protein
MLQSLADKEDEDMPTGQITPITNMQKATIASRLDRESTMKRKAKSKISTLLCREIFQRKQEMEKEMKRREKQASNEVAM